MPVAIQDRIPHNHCWGCGTLNPRGLRIKSFVVGDEAVCTFQPSPDHMAGPTHVLYGGILAAVIDCHSVCTAIADVYRAAGQELGAEPHRWCVTASLESTTSPPPAIDRPVELRARVREVKGRKRFVECSVQSEGTEVVRAEVIAVEVPAGWGGAQ